MYDATSIDKWEKYHEPILVIVEKDMINVTRYNRFGYEINNYDITIHNYILH